MSTLDRTILGKRFGRLTVNGRSDGAWDCQCDCGATKRTQTSHLKSGLVQSCGCLHLERVRAANLTHGMSDTPIYRIWRTMICRCTLPSSPYFKDYGGRGIKVCDRWRAFENFFADMGHRPDGMSLERLNNDLGYDPSNVKWATAHDQNRNMRSNLFVEFRGKRMILADAVRESGLHRATVMYRIRELGWDAELALSTPVIKGPKASKWKYRHNVDITRRI